jgi:hypothetical protein
MSVLSSWTPGDSPCSISKRRWQFLLFLCHTPTASQGRSELKPKSCHSECCTSSIIEPLVNTLLLYCYLTELVKHTYLVYWVLEERKQTVFLTICWAEFLAPVYWSIWLVQEQESFKVLQRIFSYLALKEHEDRCGNHTYWVFFFPLG